MLTLRPIPGGTMAQLEVDGTALFYEEQGDGAMILMLHGGLGMDHTYFRPDFDQLDDLGRVVYLDHRGNGRSGRTDDPITIESLAHDAAAVIEALAGSATVIGHSFGGFIAQELAASHGPVVERLVLLDTTAGHLGSADDPDADPGPRLPAELATLFASLPGCDHDDDYANLVGKFVPWYMHGDPAPLRDRMRETIFGVRAMQEGFASLATWSAADRLGGLSMPTLVVAGEHDHVTSRQQAERIARLVPHASLGIFANAGHFPWLDQPRAFFSTLRDWLSETSPADDPRSRGSG
jgi:proline iminopeptidase